MYTDIDRNNDFNWFLDNYEDLFKEYGKKEIAIKNKSVIGVFDDTTSALKELNKSYKIGEYILQTCNGNESGYTCCVMTLWASRTTSI